MEDPKKCRVCSGETSLKWSSNIQEELTSQYFAITDTNYGVTSTIYKCKVCGFLQCPELTEVLNYYEELEDPYYEQGRRERALQATALLKNLNRTNQGEQLLDIGAGTGILVEEALKTGFQAEGIEPSKWLQQQAMKRNLPVKRGLLNEVPEEEQFDYITLIDVIEHVEDPIALLKDASKRLKPGGRLLIATPDCGSLFACILGRKWWHYRVAHIGYFNLASLKIISKKTGFEVKSVSRPGWYFTLDYLWVRLLAYLPEKLRLRPMAWMKKVTIAINLRDSLLVNLEKF